MKPDNSRVSQSSDMKAGAAAAVWRRGQHRPNAAGGDPRTVKMGADKLMFPGFDFGRRPMLQAAAATGRKSVALRCLAGWRGVD